jgi:hypothetical protein
MFDDWIFSFAVNSEKYGHGKQEMKKTTSKEGMYKSSKLN